MFPPRLSAPGVAVANWQDEYEPTINEKRQMERYVGPVSKGVVALLAVALVVLIVRKVRASRQ